MWARGARSLTRNEQGFSRSHHDPFPSLPLFSATRGFLPFLRTKVEDPVEFVVRELVCLHRFPWKEKSYGGVCVCIYIYTRVACRRKGSSRVNRLFAYGVYTNFMRVKEILSSLFLTGLIHLRMRVSLYYRGWNNDVIFEIYFRWSVNTRRGYYCYIVQVRLEFYEWVFPVNFFNYIYAVCCLL